MSHSVLTQTSIKAAKEATKAKPHIYKHTRSLQKSAKNFREDFAELDSTNYAESMDAKRKNYQIKPEYPDPLAVKIQLAAIKGTYGFQSQYKNKYFNNAHYDLVKELVPIRQSFRSNKVSVDAQRAIAKKELKHWLTYLERRKETISKQPDYWIEDSSKNLLKESFDRLRNRDTQRVNGADLVEVHGCFSKNFTFKVPIHPRNLSQIIHPH